MREKLKLNEGDDLRHVKSRSKGTMGQTDIDTYEIIDANGNVVGSVVHTDETKLKGLRRVQTLEQKDAQGNIVVDVQWSD